jgi:hypothetical protein
MNNVGRILLWSARRMDETWYLYATEGEIALVDCETLKMLLTQHLGRGNNHDEWRTLGGRPVD